MKRLVLLSALGMVSSAFAQSSLTISGVVDATLSRVSGSGRGYRAGLNEGGLSASRLVFRGREDLGGGTSAFFVLDGGLDLDNGTASGYSFQRQSIVGLAGTFGEVTLGRDRTPTYWLVGAFNPFALRGVGKVLNVSSPSLATAAGRANPIRLNNTVSYLLPSSLGGVYGQAQYAFGEQSSDSLNSRTNGGYGVRVGYRSDKFHVALAETILTQQSIGNAASTAGTVTRPDLTIRSAGASFDFGFLRPMVYFSTSQTKGGSIANGVANDRLDTLAIAATAPLGRGLFKISVARYDLRNSANDATQLAIGYVYNLSRRTAIYATGAVIQNRGVATYFVNGPAASGSGGAGLATIPPVPGGRSNGLDFGVRHTF